MKIMLAKKEERRSETLSQGTCEDRRHCHTNSIYHYGEFAATNVTLGILPSFIEADVLGRLP